MPSGNINSTIMSGVRNDLITGVSLRSRMPLVEWHVKFTRIWQNDSLNLWDLLLPD